MTPDRFANAYRNGLQSTTRLLLSKGIVLEDAEEYAQTAWARGWEARAQLKDEDRVVQWVNSIAINTMCNALRRSKRFEALDDKRTRVARTESIADKVDAQKLLARCSELDRSLILHRYAGGFEMEEIAHRHGLSGVATRVRIHRAKVALRRFTDRELPLAA
ncbi:MAG: RNA polymerase sigma factor [Bryobacteraceae bacterium]